jgi:signal peptidase
MPGRKITELSPLLEEGSKIKIPLKGLSMYPFIAGERDEVILAGVGNRNLKKNDIVLYISDDGSQVLHRIHHIGKTGYFMLGDAHTEIEGPIQRENIYAIAETIIRKGKAISCKSLLYRAASRTWLALRLVRPYIIRAALRILPFIRKLKNGFGFSITL